MKHRTYHSGSSLTIALFFVSLTVCLILAGLLLKLFLVWKASSFDGNHQYILEVDENNQKGELLIFSPSTQSLSTVYVQGSTPSTFGSTLGVPEDARVTMSISSDISRLLEHMLFIQAKKEITNLDIVRLLIFVNTLKSSGFTSTTITLPLDTQTSEKTLPTLFMDKDIYNENLSVSVVNATGVSGLGSTVAHMLTNLGVNVVSVTSSDTVSSISQLTAHSLSSYTVFRLHHLFGITPEVDKNTSIADITLVIGKNLLPQVQ